MVIIYIFICFWQSIVLKMQISIRSTFISILSHKNFFQSVPITHTNSNTFPPIFTMAHTTIPINLTNNKTTQLTTFQYHQHSFLYHHTKTSSNPNNTHKPKHIPAHFPNNTHTQKTNTHTPKPTHANTTWERTVGGGRCTSSIFPLFPPFQFSVRRPKELD